MGAIHSTKISGLRFENFLGQMDRNGSEWSRSIPLAKRVPRSFKMADVGSLLLVLELDDDFDCASYFMRRNLSRITDYFEQTVPRYLPVELKDLQTTLFE